MLGECSPLLFYDANMLLYNVILSLRHLDNIQRYVIV